MKTDIEISECFLFDNALTACECICSLQIVTGLEKSVKEAREELTALRAALSEGFPSQFPHSRLVGIAKAEYDFFSF